MFYHSLVVTLFADAALVAHANVYKLAGVPFQRGKMEKKTLEDLTQEEKADVESVLSRIRDTAGKLSVTVDAAVKGFSVERHAETYAYMGVALPQEPLPAEGAVAGSAPADVLSLGDQLHAAPFTRSASLRRSTPLGSPRR